VKESVPVVVRLSARAITSTGKFVSLGLTVGHNGSKSLKLLIKFFVIH
jgi:hypothetical protein